MDFRGVTTWMLRLLTGAHKDETFDRRRAIFRHEEPKELHVHAFVKERMSLRAALTNLNYALGQHEY